MIVRLRLFIFGLLLLAACKKKDDPAPPPASVDLASARFTDFALSELAYADIQLLHPVLANGAEAAEGNIRVLLPQTAPTLQLTPRSSNFTNAAFTVSPALGTVRDFSTPVLFTITSNVDPSKKVHYRVTIERQPNGGGNGGNGAPALTAFRLEKARNPQLTADITASAIVENPGSLGKVYLFVPAGTDFSALRATATASGGTLFYSQDPAAAPQASTTAYPATGLAIDYTYPKHFYIVVKNATAAAAYEVIADVQEPLRADDGTVPVPGVAFGNNAVRTVSRLRNVGNHPLSLDGIAHLNALPANATALRASTALPSGGLLPGASADLRVTVNGTNNGPGNYRVTAAFSPKISGEEDASPYLLPAQIELSTTIDF